MSRKHKPSLYTCTCRMHSTTVGLWGYVLLCLVAMLPAKLWAQQRAGCAMSDSLRVLQYDSIANELMKTPDSAQGYVNAGMALARKISYKKGIALLTNDQAIVYMEKGDNEQALSGFEQAVKLFETLGAKKEMGKAYKDMALVNLYKADHEKAMLLVLKALDIFEANHLDTEIPLCYAIMGYIHVQQGDLKQGMKDHQKDYDLAAALLERQAHYSASEQHRIISAYLEACRNLANVNTRTGNYANSLYYLKKGLEHASGTPLLDARIKLLVSLALVHNHLQETKQAISVLKEALALAAENKMYYNQAIAYANLAPLYDDAGMGLKYYDSALSIAKSKANDVMLVANILKEKSGYAKENGNYSAALEAAEQYHDVNDSVFSVEKTVAIKNLESINKLNKTKVEMQQMELKNLRSTQTIYIIGAVMLVLAVTLAITMWYQSRLKKLHKEVLAQKEELAELNKTKDKVFSIISHDLKSPLSTASGMLALLRSGDVAHEDRQYVLDKLLRQNENAIDITDKLLAWGSFELRKEQVQKTFLVKEELKSTLQLARELAMEKSINFIEALDEQVQLTTNPYHFEFIIRNLLQNAIKFTKPGGEVSISYKYENARHIFLVRDNGIGIAPEIANKLYHTAVASTYGTDGEKGIGIGLLLVKKYVDANGQHLTAESSPGKGTTFRYEVS